MSRLNLHTLWFYYNSILQRSTKQFQKDLKDKESKYGMQENSDQSRQFENALATELTTIFSLIKATTRCSKAFSDQNEPSINPVRIFFVVSHPLSPHSVHPLVQQPGNQQCLSLQLICITCSTATLIFEYTQSMYYL
jgi:hypothetical protein